MNEEKRYGVEAPIFSDDWDDDPEANHLILIGGMAAYDEERMASAYKMAGDTLVEQALRSGDRSWEMAAPILFLYRHAVELYLKQVVHGKKHHNLVELVTEADKIATHRVGKKFPDWVMARLLEFAAHDPSGTAFRYADGKQPLQFVEYAVNLSHLRRVVEILTEGLAKLAILEETSS